MSGKPTELHRRAFLNQAVASALPLAVGAARLRAAVPETEIGQRDASPTDSRVESEGPYARVAMAASRHGMDRLLSHPRLLRELFEGGLALLTNTEPRRPADAWHKLLSPEDVIGIKFNRSGADAFESTPAMARMLTESLTQAGWAPERIVLIEIPASLGRDLHTQPPQIGWSQSLTDFGSGKDHLALVLDQVTALINVPFLKTHNIARFTGCLKNLSHALVRHPARYHDGGCVPYIADIVAIPAIREKLRLNVMNALRAIWAGGPDVKAEYTFEPRALLLSTDPVALDSTGLDVIDLKRGAKKLPPLGGRDGLRPLWLAAKSHRLGVAERDLIRRLQIRM